MTESHREADPTSPCAEQVEEYRRVGFVSGPRLLADDVADDLAGLIREMVFNPAHPRFRELNRSTNEPFLHLPRLWNGDLRFAVLHTHPAIGSWARALLDLREIQVFEDRLFYKPAGEDQRIRAWHQDAEYLPLHQPFQALGAWIALTDVTADTGAMWMLPGSQAWGAIEGRLESDLSEDAVRSAGFDATPVVCEVPKGHVHFHHPDVWHGSSGSRNAQDRIAVSVVLVNGGAVFDGAAPFARFFPGDAGHPLDPDRFPYCV